MALYNPSTWSFVDDLQNFVDDLQNTYSPSNLTSSFRSVPAGDATPMASSTSTGGQTLGAKTDPGYGYYDAASGGMVTSDGLNASGNPIFDASGNRIDYGATTQTDPFARWGGKSVYDNQINALNTGKNNVYNTGIAGGEAGYTTGRGSILDFIDSARRTQTGIDTGRANVAYSQKTGADAIEGMVGRGIQSGGVMLANKNAASSGAAGQIARAYGELGNREMAGLSGQAALENQDLTMQQNDLTNSFGTQKRKIDEFKAKTINDIATTAEADLTALETQRLKSDLPTQFAIDAEIARIKEGVTAKLGELDSLLSTEQSKINPMTGAQVAAKGYQMAESGQGGPQMFNFNTNAAPMSFSTGGNVGGASAPVYSNAFSKNKRQGV